MWISAVHEEARAAGMGRIMARIMVIVANFFHMYIWYYPSMGKSKKKGGGSGGGRTRINPLTGAIEHVAGTKAGKKRVMLPSGHPLRTHKD